MLFSADQLQLKHLVESDDDVESEQHDSILSFDSVGSSCSAHVEQATLFESSTGALIVSCIVAAIYTKFYFFVTTYIKTVFFHTVI